MFGKKNEDDSIWGTYEKEQQAQAKERVEKELEETFREEKHYHGMFEEDRSSHRMSKKKEKTIVVVVIVLVVIIAVAALILRVKWQRRVLARYMSAPSAPGSVSAFADPTL